MNKPLSLSLLLLLSTPPVYADRGIPPVPGPGEHLQDYAGVINPEHKETIRRLQKVSFEQYVTPIVVVTIHSMGDYGPGDLPIKRFGAKWFNKWQIGMKGPDGELINKGILLLISIGDRKSRIELGAEWGQTHNSHCDRITRSVMVPRFKRGEYSGGIHDAVGELSRLARMSAAGEGLPAMDASGSAGVRSTRQGDLSDRITDYVLTASMDGELIQNKHLKEVVSLVLGLVVPLLFLVAGILDAFFKGRFSPACKLIAGGLFALAWVFGGAPFYGVIFPMALASHALLTKKWYLWWAGLVGGFICLFLFVDDNSVGIMFVVLIPAVTAGIPWSFFYAFKLIGFVWFWLTNEKVAFGLMVPLYLKESKRGGFLSSAFGGGGGGGGFSSGGFSGGGGSSGSW